MNNTQTNHFAHSSDMVNANHIVDTNKTLLLEKIEKINEEFNGMILSLDSTHRKSRRRLHEQREKKIERIKKRSIVILIHGGN